MHHITILKQKGISLPSLLMWSMILILASILGMKLAPAYIEHASIKKALVAIASDPDLQNATPSEIRLSFNKRAQIDNIDVISGRDIRISKEKGGKRVLSTNYSVKIPLVANLSLYLDFYAASD